MIRMGMTMIEEVLLKDGQHRHEIYVIQHFCDRIVAMLNTVEVLTGNRIANDVGYQKSAADAQLGNAVPVSLQQIVRKMEACNDHSIATDLARYANSLIDAAWSGSMCEKQLGRKIPLKEAIKGCAGAPLMAVRRCIKNLADKKFRKKVGASFEVSMIYRSYPCHIPFNTISFIILNINCDLRNSWF